jgi:hypothetical protein
LKITGKKMENDSTKKLYPHFTHSPFSLEHGGVKAVCDENGKITLTKNHEDDSFDEVETSASLIYMLADMLETTKKRTWKDEPYKKGRPSLDKRT